MITVVISFIATGTLFRFFLLSSLLCFIRFQLGACSCVYVDVCVRLLPGNVDGCARQYYDKCPGGDPTVPGHFALAPCYNLGLGACEAETGVCRCPEGGAEATCIDTANSGSCTCPTLDEAAAGGGDGGGDGGGAPGPMGPMGPAGPDSSSGLFVLAAVPGWAALLGVICAVIARMMGGKRETTEYSEQL